MKIPFGQKRLIYLAIGLVVLIVFFVIVGKGGSEAQTITYTVTKGKFKAEIYSTGQLQAEKSVAINIPSELASREIRIYEIKISDLIDEGTVVDSGQFVALLDQSAVEELLTKNKEQLESFMRGFEDAKIDTNINLSNLRDGLINAKVNLEEKRLIMNQSMYESPAVKRQATLDMERTQRQLEQEVRNYELKKKQDEFKVQRAYLEVSSQRTIVDDIEDLFDQMTITAPQSGMVIYDTDRYGNKIKEGSSVSSWRPTFATLPDLKTMISKTFINEIDISRIKTNQDVKVGIDAFPDKVFDGRVGAVANIGQVLPGGDSKVFEVIVKLIGVDSELKPGMSTSNAITTEVLDSVLFIPLDAIHENDSLQFVVVQKRGNLKKHIIDPGPTNENFMVVNKGVVEEDVLLLSMPEKMDELEYVGLDIYEGQKQAKAEVEHKREKLKENFKKFEGEKPLDSDAKPNKGKKAKAVVVGSSKAGKSKK